MSFFPLNLYVYMYELVCLMRTFPCPLVITSTRCIRRKEKHNELLK